MLSENPATYPLELVISQLLGEVGHFAETKKREQKVAIKERMTKSSIALSSKQRSRGRSRIEAKTTHMRREVQIKALQDCVQQVVVLLRGFIAAACNNPERTGSEVSADS